MVIIGVFKNNTGIFMHTFNKFLKGEKGNATGVNDVSTFYNETVGNANIDFTATSGITLAGIKKTSAGFVNFRNVTMSLKKTGSYNDLEFDFGAVHQMGKDYRLVVHLPPEVKSDINFCSLELQTASGASNFSKTTFDAPNWTDDANETPIMTVDSG